MQSITDSGGSNSNSLHGTIRAKMTFTLPSIAEILACKNRLSRPDATNTVVKLNDCTAVKYGYQVLSLEADNLDYLSSTSDVPVPRVVGTLVEPDTNRHFIVMELVHGQTLESIMDQLTPEEKVHICQKIQAALSSLRRLPAPGYIGSLSKRPCYDGMFYTGETHDTLISGPFPSERAMRLGILKNIARLIPAAYLDFVAELFLTDAHESRICFTRGDLQPKNILVKRLHDQQEKEIGFDITIIDWEFSGWYPEYWEFCNASIAARARPQWLSMLRSVLPTPVIEFPLLELVRGILLC